MVSTAKQIGFKSRSGPMCCGGCLFRQVLGIPVRINCAASPAVLFIYSYENELLDNMITEELPGNVIYAIDTLMI